MHWNIPNILTVLRLFAAPGVAVMFLYFHRPWADWFALALFVSAAATDYFDGYLARLWKQESKFGAMLDPIADKLLVLSALILLVQVDRVSALVEILIIAREVAVTGLRAIAASEGLIMSAEVTGKYKMALQVIAIVLLVLEGTVVEAIGNLHLAGIVTLYLSLILGYVSGAQYVWSFWRQVGAKGL